MSTPTIFLSAASDDLKDWRDILHKAFDRAGCKVHTQGHSLGASTAGVPELLRQHLDKSDFIVHLAGMAYGAEPEQSAFDSHPGFKCSYTQFEYYFAHQHGKHVIAYVCAEDFPFLPFVENAKDDADRERRRLLQLAHRERVAKGWFTGTPLEGHPKRPLSEAIANASKLLEAIAAAVGTIRDCSETCATKIQKELNDLATKRHEELLDYVKDMPSRVADELERRRLIRPTFEFKADISRIDKYAPAELIGREEELKLLNAAWAKVQSQEAKRPHLLTFVALGGEGKTSLVAKWAAELAHLDWPGCDAVFAWSFYSQGTRDQVAASSDLFLKEALTFFGDDADKEFAASPAGAFEKGQRLARIVGQRRNLLILDGLEPLQYAPTSPTPGQLKDQDIAALLKGFAQNNHGMCVVTTRHSLPDLKAFWQTTAPEVKLLRLSRDAGVHLLKSFNVRGSDRKNIPFNNGKELLSEFEKLVEDVKGHALTLNLLGSYLRHAHAGDIRKRDLIDFGEADAANEHRHHVVHVMDAYVRWLSPSGFWAWMRRLFSEKERETQVEGKKALAVLRLVGLFDRPVTDDCFGALLKTPAISSLTEPLVELNEAQRNTVLKRLEDAKLLTVNRDASGALVSLDAHPHLREYFARQLRTQQSDAWCAAHRRLYEHLCATAPECTKYDERDAMTAQLGMPSDKPQPTLEDLQPLYQAVAHGCHAALQQEACDKVYRDRIRRGNQDYVSKQLGAFGAEISAVANFFAPPWKLPSPNLSDDAKAWLLAIAAFGLRALGRLTEALEPMQAGLAMRVAQKNWLNAAISANNLSELELTLGDVAGAVGYAEQSVSYAKDSGNTMEHLQEITTLADAMHQAGQWAEAETHFRTAESMQAEHQPGYPLLYSVWGFRYCDLLVAVTERAAWQIMLGYASDVAQDDYTPHLESCRAVSHRATRALELAERYRDLLSVALDHLTLSRAALYTAILERRALQTARRELDAAVDGLRRAGTQDQLPRGLLTRAWLRFLTGARTGPESAQEDLDEAWEIAERGPMKLFLADIHLYRARLFGGVREEGRGEKYPWESPAADLAAAEKLINECGYHRRDEELADAKKAILGK